MAEVVLTAAGNGLSKLFGVIFTSISNPITLVHKCNNNVDNLKQQVDKLKLKRKTAEDNVDAFHRRGEETGQELQNWLTRANNLIEAADKLVADAEENAKKKCFFGLCLNPKSRYQISKKAEENSKALAEFVDEARGFNLAVAHIPAPQKEVATPVKGFEDFNSRRDLLEKIMEALQSESSRIIGVHGMPGMGKTMLVKEVKRRADRDKLFDGVAMAFVSRNADLKNIQVDIARGLGLDQLPNGITTQEAAEHIKARLKNMKKALIILDDIWVPGIDLEDLGIPLRNEPKTNEGSSSREEFADCKILLTSRDSDVLSDLMGSPQNFSLHQLEFQEAWELLKRIVGDRAESDEIRSTAIEIAQECGGLPLAITTMAKALKNKKPYEWMDAVRILKRPSAENFDGVSAKVYSAIEVSYSHLDSEKLKKTFLLCCLMGHRSSVQDLLKHGVGLGLFASTIEEARNEVLTLIRKLRASSLLIDDDDNNRFDMHDLIHDVAVSIACKERLGLLLTGDHEPKEWSDMEAMKDFKWIRMRYANVDGLPEELESPHLSYFCLSNKDPSLQIPPNFFRGMQRLKVLDLTEMHMSSLPSSISLLKNLHTLCLDQSVLGDIRIIGQLKNLEVLSLLRSDLEELPREIGQLTRLKLLDLSNCAKLKIIPPRVLANMSRLEELYLGSFDGWEVEENENQRNVSVAELKHLKKLTSLEVCISHIQMISNDLFFENLKRYKIFIGDKWGDRDSSIGGSRILKLHLNASISYNRLVEWLLKTAEKLHLRELASVKNVVAELNIEGFRDLKDLYVCDAPEIQHIIKPIEGFLVNAFPNLEVLFLQNLINLEKIFQGQFKKTAFNKLRKITVESCDKLKNLFSSSIAKQFLQLQEISVRYCSNMEEIVDDEEQGSINDIVEATELKFGEVLRSLKLEHLPKFRSVNGSCKSMQLFNEQVAFPNLEELQLSRININTIWHASITSSNVEKLRKLIIKECDNLEYLFSSSMARDMVMLGHLEIRGCKKMREVLFTENVKENGNLIFRQLRFLLIKNLPQLKRFCYGNYIEFPCLSELLISECPELKTFVSSSSFECSKATSDMEENTCTPLFDTKVTFPKLERLTIESLLSLEKIWDNQLGADSFCQLNYLMVWSCEKLLNIFPFSLLEKLRNLDKLEILFCDSLDEIFESQQLGAGQSQAQNIPHATLGEPITKFIFPTLTHLRLRGLPKLKAFCYQMHSTEWPSLKKLEVRGCDQVQTFASELPSFPRTPGDDQLEIQIKSPLFWISKVTFPCLEELELERNNIMNEIWHGQCLWDYFPKLKVLKLSQLFLKQSVVQPSQSVVVQPSLCQPLPNLEKLVVRKAPFHEIFQCQGLGGGENPAPALTQLSELRLFELLELVFYNLKTLEVKQCSNSKNLVPYFISFKNLTSLEVSECHELINLVGYSTAKSMVQLTRMSISKCDMLKEIVACMDDEVKDGIVFDKLKYLELLDLPRLASFCPGNCNFDLPFLEEVTVMGCPNMQIFSQGECRTYNKLQKVKSIKNEDEGLWEGNLNSTIQKMFMEKVGYDGLANFKFSEFPELIEIWNKKPQEIFPFKRIKTLEVCNYNSSRYLLATSMAPGLAQLNHLKVANCASMEQVITGEGAEKMFPRLLSIILESCPNLKCFYEGSSRLEFPWLDRITVVDCPVLAAFASSFSSEQGKEITTNGRESEERLSNIPSQPFFSDKATFPRLRELKLEGNNIMKEVWRGHHPGGYFPNLAVLELINFTEQLAVLPPYFFQSLPNLRKLVVSNASFDEIFQFHAIAGVGAEERPANALPQLTVLKLSKLHELKFLWKEELHLELVFYNLGILELQECSKLKNLVPSFISFENLTTLVVSNCHELIHVVGYFTAKSMMQLKRASISECDMIGEIVALGNEEMKDGICFSNLEYLELRGLPRLESFCFGNGGFDFPTLREVIVLGCPNMQIFSRGQLSTPKLQEVKLKEDGDECCWYGDLNSTIQHLFMEKV